MKFANANGAPYDRQEYAIKKQNFCLCFYLSSSKKIIDKDIMEIQSVAIKHEKGLVVILGCSHVGVINILGYVLNQC